MHIERLVLTPIVRQEEERKLGNICTNKQFLLVAFSTEATYLLSLCYSYLNFYRKLKNKKVNNSGTKEIKVVINLSRNCRRYLKNLNHIVLQFKRFAHILSGLDVSSMVKTLFYNLSNSCTYFPNRCFKLLIKIHDNTDV